MEDDSAIRISIGEYLEANEFEVLQAGSCGAGEEIFRSGPIDAAIIDYVLPDGTGLDLMGRFKEADCSVPTVILTGQGSIELAVQAIKEGAEHFLTKPVELSTLCVVLRRILRNQRNVRKERASRSRRLREAVDPFVGASPAISRLAELAERIASADSPVLIQGETGSGKGVLARWIHDHSSRSEEPFLDLNCAGLTRELLETELFGHEKGAFTGAVSSKQGLFEVAHRGTFFLDEIGDMELGVQPKLLKVVEQKRFRRLGATIERSVDVRLIAASHHDLATLVKQKKFREDLFFRISTVPLQVPPLRDRLEDVPLLATFLLERIATDLGCGELMLSDDAVVALKSYSWPGNIRELQNALENAALLAPEKLLTSSDFHFLKASRLDLRLDQTTLTLEELERRYIAKILEEENGHVMRAAERLGIPRSSLYVKIKTYGLTQPT
ncbi:MAG: sigma-54-dependent transcriptional regulator [Terriglobales bacterium]